MRHDHSFKNEKKKVFFQKYENISIYHFSNNIDNHFKPCFVKNRLVNKEEDAFLKISKMAAILWLPWQPALRNIIF